MSQLPAGDYHHSIFKDIDVVSLEKKTDKDIKIEDLESEIERLDKQNEELGSDIDALESKIEKINRVVQSLDEKTSLAQVKELVESMV